jgi:thioredoxin-related protein
MIRFTPHVVLSSILLLASCATTSAPVIHPPNSTVEWFPGTVEEGLAQAKAQEKPVFLYWGAVWCPPCNEIKAVVLSSPDVGEVLKATIPIYLDGDSDRAQLWADKLHVSGYPSMLLLDKSGREILRIAEFVEASEFVATVRSALTANRSQADAIARGIVGQASEEDWTILANAGWDAPSVSDYGTRLKLTETIPPGYPAQRALLAARLLEDAATQPPPGDVAATIRDSADALLEAILSSSEAIYAARSTLVGPSKEILTWLYLKGDDAKRTAAVQRWLKAVQWLGQQPSTSTAKKMLAKGAEAQLWLLAHPGQWLPSDLSKQVHAAVAQADKEAVTQFQRHAVISDAADVLAEAGDIDSARTLLWREMKVTDTPWYYQSSLARIEQKAGHDPEALAWSAKARLSAQGTASKIQWLVADLLLNAKITSAEQPTTVATLLTEYYTLAFQLPDGFSGRNAARARQVARKMRDWEWPEVKAVITLNKAKCQKLTTVSGQNDCHIAFAAE